MPKGLYEIGHFFNMGLTPAPLSNNVKKTLQDYYSEASLWEWKIKQDHLRWWVLHHSPHYYSLARFWVLGAIFMTIIRPYLEVPTIRKHNLYRGKKLPRWIQGDSQNKHNTTTKISLYSGERSRHQLLLQNYLLSKHALQLFFGTLLNCINSVCIVHTTPLKTSIT